MKPNDNSQHLEIITITQKNSFIKELYLFSILFQKKEKNFLNGRYFLKFENTSYKRAYYFESNMIFFSKKTVSFCEITQDEMKVILLKKKKIKINRLLKLMRKKMIIKSLIPILKTMN